MCIIGTLQKITLNEAFKVCCFFIMIHLYITYMYTCIYVYIYVYMYIYKQETSVYMCGTVTKKEHKSW